MLFTPNQISELLDIIRFQHVVFAVEMVGTESLTDHDREMLRLHGIEPDLFSYGEVPELEQAFQFGRISSALSNYQLKEIKYNDFKKFLRNGGYEPLSEYESLALEAMKHQSFSAIKGLGNKICDSATQVIGANEMKRRAAYEEILREELSSGIINRKSVSDIMRDIGARTGDWQRDLGRVVETEMHNAYDEGRACHIHKHYGEDAYVYKSVYEGACRYCIKLYLTGGIGSQPRIFRLSELRKNGTNIGVKAADWKPVIGSTHPHCRCEITPVPDGYIWDKDKRAFVAADPDYKFQHEFTVTINIGGKKYTY